MKVFSLRAPAARSRRAAHVRVFRQWAQKSVYGVVIATTFLNVSYLGLIAAPHQAQAGIREDVGAIYVTKLIDTNDDGTFEGGNTTANDLGFHWGIDDVSPATLFGAGQYEVTLGDHTVTESAISGYHFVGWYYTYEDTFHSCSNIDSLNGTTLPIPVTVQGAQFIFLTLCNQVNAQEQLPTGEITVNKMVDTNGDGDFSDPDDGGNDRANGIGFNWQLDAGPDHAMGDTVTAVSGTHSVTENTINGYHYIGWYFNNTEEQASCDNPESLNSGWPNEVYVSSQWHVRLTLCNVRDTGAISGTKFHDHNGDGIRNEGDEGIGGITITTDGSQATTDESGQYTMSGVPTGLHCVVEVTPSGWIPTKNQGSICEVNVTRNETTSGVDFGNFQLTSIAGMKFNDHNSNGLKEAGDEGVTNWTISLWQFDANHFSHPELYGVNDGYLVKTTTTTDVTGAYSFPNLGPGTYRLTEGSKEGWTAVSPVGGRYDAILLLSGQAVTGKDFGNHFTPPTSSTVTITDPTPVPVVTPRVLGATDQPSLTLTKKAEVTTTIAGSTIGYSVTVLNGGTIDDTNVIVTDTLPDGFVFDDTGTTVRTWTIPSLRATESKTFTYLVRIDSSAAAGSYINTVVALGNLIDPVTAVAEVTVLAPQVLGLATTGPAGRDWVLLATGLVALTLGFIGLTYRVPLLAPVTVKRARCRE